MPGVDESGNHSHTHGRWRFSVLRGVGAATALVAPAVVIWLGLDLLVRGAPSFYPGYLTDAPRDLGRAGGIGPLLVNTALVVGLAVVLSSMLSLATALFYTECLEGSRLRRPLHALIDVGVGSPRILWGLFGGVVFGGLLGWGFSVATGVVTLACLLAPILTSGFIAGLEAVDPALREQCAALGVGRWATVRSQVLPAARPALVASVALGAGRGFGDAAALFFTVGVAAEVPGSLFDSAATLAVFVFHLLSTVPGGQASAYAAAAVLFGVTLAVQLGIAWSGSRETFARC